MLRDSFTVRTGRMEVQESREEAGQHAGVIILLIINMASWPTHRHNSDPQHAGGRQKRERSSQGAQRQASS